MNEHSNKALDLASKAQGRFVDSIEKLFSVGKPDAVFSKPVSAEGHTVITAAEVSVGMGLGFGGGTGTSPKELGSQEGEESGEIYADTGLGGGSGGGGLGSGRPVAAITISKEGVYIQPILDTTKVALALFAAVGGLLLALARRNQN